MLALRLWGRGCVLRARLEMPLHISVWMVQLDRSDALWRARDTGCHLLLPSLAFLLTGDDKLVYGQIFYTR